MRSAEAGEGGYEIDSARVGNRFCYPLCVRCILDYPKAVSQPLDGGPGDENAALQRVLGLLPAKLPGNGGD